MRWGSTGSGVVTELDLPDVLLVISSQATSWNHSSWLLKLGHSIAELLRFGEDALAECFVWRLAMGKCLRREIIIRSEAQELERGVCP